MTDVNIGPTKRVGPMIGHHDDLDSKSGISEDIIFS
jgi:hypothetical protein